MQWQAAPLFATPVFKLTIPDALKAKAFFDDHVRGLTNQDIHDQQGGLSHFHSRSNVFKIYPDLGWLQTQLESAATFVYGELMNYKKSGPMRITNAWFNLCEKGSSQPPHNHVNCLLCGTVYLHTDQNSKLMFHHPQKIESQHAELFDCADTSPNQHGLGFHKQEAQIPVQTGDCLFWPARLKHGYTNNQTPDRLSLSFNLLPETLNVDYQLL